MSERLALDASAALHVVMRSAHARRLADLLSAASVVTSPALYCAETANALWKYLRAGELDRDTAVTRLEEVHSLVDSFVPDRELCTEALAAAAGSGHPVYDLLYLVLARRHAATLVTTDRRMAELARKMDIPVVYPGATT